MEEGKKDYSMQLDLFLIFVIFLLIVTICVMIAYMKKNSLTCLSNPVKYYMELKNTTCICGKDLLNYQVDPLWLEVNKT